MPGGAGHNRGNSNQNFATPRIFGVATMNKLDIDGFMFDFAASAHNTVAVCYWDEVSNALQRTREEWLFKVQQSYNTGWGWLNPPFDDIAPWARHMAELKEDGGQGAFLVPAGVGSTWWRDYVHGIAHVLLVNGRIPFDPLRPHWGYPKDCALCVYAPSWEPGYDVWSWLQDVPDVDLAVHKGLCAQARAREKAEKKTVVRTEEYSDADV